jgi:hypothetical protein
MAKHPLPEAAPSVMIKFPDLTGDRDWGRQFSSFEFKGMLNGGYIIRAELFDSHFNLLKRLMGGAAGDDQQYLKKARDMPDGPVACEFQIRWHSEIEVNYPEKTTRIQKAFVLSVTAGGTSADKGLITLVAIDPPSWYLNTGDASGEVYKGNVGKVIEQVLDKYCPVQYEVSKTNDSEQNKWWMMRQDPKTFIASLTDWSSAVTANKTQWIIGMDGNPVAGGPQLIIKEQNEVPSTQRALYHLWATEGHDNVNKWELMTDNALAITNTKLVTSGISAMSGGYMDKITDKEEKKLWAKDITTKNKKVARTKRWQSFTKPDDSAGKDFKDQIGWSAVTSIPEVYSAGDIGMKFIDYIDGRPRAMYLNLVNALFRMKLTVTGDGVWDNTLNLGVDTAFLQWFNADGQPWFVTGNWIVNGFHHHVKRRIWWTDVYVSRYDYDSEAVKVGG